MQILNFKNEYKEPICVALGFFDSVHLGHKKVIQNCINLSKELNARPAIFTFNNNPYKILKKDSLLVYTFNERKKIFEKLGLEIIIEEKFDLDFMNLTYLDFFNKLIKNFNVLGVSVGSDYTFGHLGKGTPEILEELCMKEKIQFVKEECFVNGIKDFSSTLVRKYIEKGNIAKINKILPFDYSITGKVVHCNGIGANLGFPTANIMIEDGKLPLKTGVYVAYLEYDGKIYNSLTNVGNRPTFNENVYKIESFILDFNKDIYNEEITIYFKKRIRDIKKFKDEKSLIDQITSDLSEINND